MIQGGAFDYRDHLSQYEEADNSAILISEGLKCNKNNEKQKIKLVARFQS